MQRGPKLDPRTVGNAVDFAAVRPDAKSGCVTGVGALVAFVFGGLLANGAPMLPDSAIFGRVTGVALVLVAITFLLRRDYQNPTGGNPPRPGARGPLIAAISSLCFGGGVAMLATVVLRHPIVHEFTCHNCETHEMRGPGSTLIQAAVIAAIAGPAITFTASLLAAAFWGGRGTKLLRHATWLAALLTIGGMLVAVVTGTRALRARRDHGWPEYLDSLPLVATVPAPPKERREAETATRADIDASGRWRPRGNYWFEADVPELGPDVHLYAHGSMVELGRRKDDDAQGHADGFHALSGILSMQDGRTGKPPVPIVFHRDTAHGLIYLSSSYAKPTRTEGVLPTRIAVRVRDLHGVDVRATDLADWLAPPAQWVVLAAVGLLVSIVVLLRRPALAVLLQVRARWRGGALQADGTLLLADGQRLPNPPWNAAGNVVAILGAQPSQAAESYRASPADADLIVPCTVERLEGAIELSLFAQALTAIGVALICGAPLLVLMANHFAP